MTDRDPFRGADVFQDGGHRLIEVHQEADCVVVCTPNGSVHLSPPTLRVLAECMLRAADRIEAS